MSSRPLESVDIVGPLRVQSTHVFQYVLTFIDLCFRWVEAVPLKYFTARIS